MNVVDSRPRRAARRSDQAGCRRPLRRRPTAPRDPRHLARERSRSATGRGTDCGRAYPACSTRRARNATPRMASSIRALRSGTCSRRGGTGADRYAKARTASRGTSASSSVRAPIPESRPPPRSSAGVDAEAGLSWRTQIYDSRHQLVRRISVLRTTRRESGALSGKIVSIAGSDAGATETEVYSGDADAYAVPVDAFALLDGQAAAVTRRGTHEEP